MLAYAKSSQAALSLFGTWRRLFTVAQTKLWILEAKTNSEIMFFPFMITIKSQVNRIHRVSFSLTMEKLVSSYS